MDKVEQLFLFLLLLFVSPTFSLNQEGLFLLQAKHQLSHPSHSLSNWNRRDATPCSWTGVTCDRATGAVTSLHLSDSELSGPFPSAFCRLPSLSILSLSNNNLNSSLSATALSACSTLRRLDLSLNLFSGPIPNTLSHLPSLLHLNLSFNNFSGNIPATFGNFRRLESLSLVNNLLTGKIPTSLGNVSTLKELHLAYNDLGGHIPITLGNLTDLEDLWVAKCNLVGTIPLSLGKLVRLWNLDLSQNMLTGPLLEPVFAGLSSIVQIELYENFLSGELPRGPRIANLTQLERFDASENELTGTIPDELCRLKNLGSLNLDVNSLEGSLPESIAESENLYQLMLYNNSLSGSLPSGLGSKSQLQILDVSYNQFSGEIPASLCRGGGLQELLLGYNSFLGEIPESLGDCKSLMRIRLGNNNLSGTVPYGLWGLPHMYLLELVENSLSGPISNSISGASNLTMLLISWNNFSGSIPDSIGSLYKLEDFIASYNSLSGQFPTRMIKLGQLERLVLNDNQLSGEIPPGFGDLKKLNEIDLANNRIEGYIPIELGYLPVLNFLDLSGNRLTGQIPMELQNLKLDHLNLSNNQLSGKIPSLYATESYRDSFLGNRGLCGDNPGLCPTLGKNKKRKNVWVFCFIFALAGGVLIIGVNWFYSKFRNFKKMKKKGCSMSKWRSFHKLGFSEFEIVKLMNEDNVIGSGSSGKVYKVVLSNGEVVAVKKLWRATRMEIGNVDPEKDGFEAEVETLGKIRHKNIVRLWCCCNNGDGKLLVYEYMPNGSLADLLHSNMKSLLNWPTRYKIAIDAAEGLSYLHNDCVPPIVHRDVKSSNILIDEEFGAKIADFGVAKIVRRASQDTESMSVIAGSYGYIAPEYAYTLRVNEKSDIYSFGVVILELVTGKPALDPEYGEKDLVRWVTSTLDEEGEDQVIDPTLDPKYREEISRVLSVGLLCTSSLPITRPSMRRVVKLLRGVTTIPKSRSGKLSPYYQEEASDNENQGSIVFELGA